MIKYNTNDVLLKRSTAGWGAVFVIFITLVHKTVFSPNT